MSDPLTPAAQAAINAYTGPVQVIPAGASGWIYPVWAAALGETQTEGHGMNEFEKLARLIRWLIEGVAVGWVLIVVFVTLSGVLEALQ